MTRAQAIPDTITVHVPFNLVKRGGRKVMQLPTSMPTRRQPDDALVKALARAFRWKCMLESGAFTTISELAERESIPSTYIARVLRLTLLAPELIEAILDGHHPVTLTLPTLMKPFPVAWEDQRAAR